MATEITNIFFKQPREIKWVAISFAELIAAQEDPADPIGPITLDTIPAGIVLEDQNFNIATGLLLLLLSGGEDNRTYLITMWLNTVGGQKLEHQVRIRVKERRG